MPSLSRTLAQWFLSANHEDIPDDVRRNTKVHVLDVIGLMLSASRTEYGRILREAVLQLGTGTQARVVGFGDVTNASNAVMINAALADSQDFDDTHNETHLHPGAHVIPAALTFGELAGKNGREVLTVAALGMELGARLAVAAPGMFVRNGFHSSAIVGTIVTTMIASRLLDLTLDQTVNAVGTAGSQAAGILQCYADGTWTQGFHPGWIAHAGLTAAYLGRAGFTGPEEVLEGRHGLFRSHIQEPGYAFDFERTVDRLDTHWESRHISLKLYPAGCVIHPYLDAILHLYEHEGLRADDVEEIIMPISHHWVPIVCEPREVKVRPASEMGARISLNYAVAEALYYGRLGLDGFREENVRNPEILDLAARARYTVDPENIPRRNFKGWVIVKTRDGRQLERVEYPWNKGHHDNPETPALIRGKFRETAGEALGADQVARIIDGVDQIEDTWNIARLIDLCVPAAG